MHVAYPYPDIYEELMEPCHITKEDVNDVVHYEDSKKVIQLNNTQAHIVFLKRMPKDYFLLIDSKWNAPILSIHNIFRVFPHTLDGLNTNPLHILQKIVDDWGYVLKIGNQYSKFIYNETFKVPKSEVNSDYNERLMSELGPHIIPIGFEQNSRDKPIGSGISRIKISGSDYDILEVLLAYVISLRKYLDYQHENDPSSGTFSGFQD